MPESITFDDLEQYACGYIGLQLDYFYSLTPRTFYNISKGFKQREEERLKENLILNRRLAFHIMLPYLKNQNITEEKFMPLYFDKKIGLNLEQEIERVEKAKLFWELVDMKRAEKNSA